MDLEVVTVTKSACPQLLLEGSPGVSDLYRPAPSRSRDQLRAELFTHLMNGSPFIVHSSLRSSRTLSVPMESYP
jgi:hypothetical protein